ncbi:MAG: Rid family detoxifying hydrolase [Synergistaceae bacterium]|jgi:2-iminobutanoate/2-iminopropanoate deaminase|nr:Rid family detoxifying hydrolase [Synergistaceae bacterium]
MEREIIETRKAPKPVGPYSHVVKYGNLIFVSGQISADLETGEIIVQDVAGQTRTALETIKNILEEIGSGMDKVLKCTIHLSDEKYFDEMNRVYSSFFEKGYPARITVFGAKLYAGIDIEIDAIAGV